MAKHKYIKTPEKLWQIFLDYKEDVKSNPRIKIEYVGRNGDRMETPVERSLSIAGFKTFAAYKIGTLDHYFKNTDGAYDEYRPIITRVREEVRAEQIDGAMVNHYNSNLTARLNGLSDKTDTNVTLDAPIFNGIDLDVPTDNSTGEDS